MKPRWVGGDTMKKDLLSPFLPLLFSSGNSQAHSSCLPSSMWFEWETRTLTFPISLEKKKMTFHLILENTQYSTYKIFNHCH